MIRLLLILLSLAGPVRAHFAQGTQVHEIVTDGAEIYVRAPLPLVFADVIAAAEDGALRSPFLYLEQTGAGSRYRLDVAQVAADPSGFAARLAQALVITRDGQPVAAQIGAVRVSPRRGDERFDSLAAARAVLEQPTTRLDPVFGQGLVEYAVRLPQGAGPLAVRAAYPALALRPGVAIDTHLTRDDGGRALTRTVAGQLTEAQSFPRTAGQSLVSFLWHGLDHIATGWDHVFLVICFALGLGWSRQLLWVVTAFTLGHSVTLMLGAMGRAPSADWFIPVVEMAIAGSVVLAALAAWRSGGRVPTAQAASLAAGVGLIHGFGFASFLSESLSPGMPGFVPALAGFNIGIELGQLVLVALTLSALWAATRAGAAQAVRLVTLLAIALVAGSWTIERGLALLV